MSIRFEQVSFIYQEDTPFAFEGLRDVSFGIEEGQYTAIIGHTGSGKSTLIQHLNALLKPTRGQVRIDSYQVQADTKEKDLSALRQLVGLVFQFPEAQLFEETVLKDVMFGPMNFGVPEADAKARAQEALRLVGLAQELEERSPFDLSGGQMRRVAIAGILAMQPKILVLDEPTAGLDPKGRQEMMRLFYDLHQKGILSIVLVTHQMDDVANYADKVLVMEGGQLIKVGTPAEVFQDRDWLLTHQIGQPSASAMAFRLKEKGLSLPDKILKVDDLTAILVKELGAKNVR